jgi:hypothetical protein
MSQRKKGTEECLFCTNPADSREDMWPLWILRRVNTRETIRRTIGEKAPYHTVSRKIRIKSVCTKCNNEWMSNLETECIPLLGSLLEDISLNLDSHYQLLASLWATKIAMVLDSVEGHSRFYLKTECEQFKNNKIIPIGTMIWTGRYFGRSLHASGGYFTANLNKSLPVADCATTTILVGHLIFEVLTVRKRSPYSERTIRMEPNLGRWNELLTPIWPITSNTVSWPPALSFSNYGSHPIAMLLTRWKRR